MSLFTIFAFKSEQSFILSHNLALTILTVIPCPVDLIFILYRVDPDNLSFFVFCKADMA